MSTDRSTEIVADGVEGEICANGVLAEMNSDARSYEIASSDVIVPLMLADAHVVADGLELLADLDESEHTDGDALRRLAALVRSMMPIDREAAVRVVLATMADYETPLEYVESADRSLQTLPGYIGSVPEGRRFVADVLVDTEVSGGREGLAKWLVDELTAE